MKMTENLKSKFTIIGEWFAYLGPIAAIFYFFNNQTTAMTNRLDETNKRIDTHFIEINKRSDILHQEFIDLLKEKRK